MRSFLCSLQPESDLTVSETKAKAAASAAGASSFLTSSSTKVVVHTGAEMGNDAPTPTIDNTDANGLVTSPSVSSDLAAAAAGSSGEVPLTPFTPAGAPSRHEAALPPTALAAEAASKAAEAAAHAALAFEPMTL